MKAVIFGPGRIGCGLAGHLLRASGWEVILAARRREVAEHFNRIGRYVVRMVDRCRTSEVSVEPVRSIWTGDRDRLVNEVAGADLIGTAVGADNLTAVAPLIAAGLAGRDDPAAVLAFENPGTAGERLRAVIATHLPERAIGQHRVSGALVSRIVTHRIGDPATDHPFVFVADPPSTFVVDGRRLAPPSGWIKGMVVAEDFEAWVHRKLYMFSAGHAATAYLGYLKGYHYIHTAIRDPEIRRAVWQVLREGQRGLAARYGAEMAGGERDVIEILARFENAALDDPIVRVGRDPRRKLGPHDRLVGAARLAERAGVAPESLSLAAAAALCFCSSQHVGTDDLLREIEQADRRDGRRRDSGPGADERFGSMVADTWRRLARGWQEDNLLLSLEDFRWSWTAGSAASGVPRR